MPEPRSHTEAETRMREGLARLKAGKHSEAEAVFRGMLHANAADPAVQYHLGITLAKQGRLADACPFLRDALLKANGGPQEWKFALDVLGAAGDLEGQAQLYRRLVTLQPRNAAAQYSLGNVLRGLGQLDAAQTAWQTAVALKPDLAQAHNNLGMLAKLHADLPGAAAAFHAAIVAMPEFSAAHRNLGTVLEQMGDLAGAEQAYRRAMAGEPDHPDTRRYLGGVLLELGRTREALEVLLEHAHGRYGGRSEAQMVAPLKAAHDREQSEWLNQHDRDPATLVIRGGGRLAGAVVNQRDSGAITDVWRRANPQIVVIDDFLHAEALAAIREYCLGSTFWRQAFPGGYLGALPEHGFAGPLLAQLGEELADAYPVIFAGHPLLQLWAFKYCGGPSGIKLHADFAAVNVNFWITPDDANRDPSRGGLVIWDKAAPADWDFQTYNNDDAAIRGFLNGAGARSTTIPYRANRAVIFDSDLFHETDAIDFREGYANRRINITLLYGWRGGERRMTA